MEYVIEPGDEHVSYRVAGECSRTTKSVLKGGFPHVAFVVAGGERGECHAEISWGDLSEFSADSSGGSTVVGDGDDGSNGVRVKEADCGEGLE